MAMYRVKHDYGKPHRRATTKEVVTLDANGVPFHFVQAGPTLEFQPGELFEPTEAELAAFSDLFEIVEGEPLSAVESLAQPTKLNPEVFTLLRKTHSGEATPAEQNVVADVTRYLEESAQGTATPEDTATLEMKLQGLGIPLFV